MFFDYHLTGNKYEKKKDCNYHNFIVIYSRFCNANYIFFDKTEYNYHNFINFFNNNKNESPIIMLYYLNI